MIVIGLLLVATWAMKKHGGSITGIGSRKRIQVIERCMLGQKQQLVIVKVDGRERVLGLSGDSIVELHTEPCTSPAATSGVQAK